MLTIDDVFRRGRVGLPSWIAEVDGQRRALPVARWLGGSTATVEDRRADAAAIALCTGPTLDLGCGPGRLTEALGRADIPALGVDSSPVAVEMTTARGGTALQRDIFSLLPGEGLWSHVLLADGNIGIGGDPLALLRRSHLLLRREGTAIVEVSSSPDTGGVNARQVRWESDNAAGEWFAWADAGVRSLEPLALEAGMHVRRIIEMNERAFVELGLHTAP